VTPVDVSETFVVVSVAVVPPDVAVGEWLADVVVVHLCAVADVCPAVEVEVVVLGYCVVEIKSSV
jgi:hypothetical protein